MALNDLSNTSLTLLIAGGTVLGLTINYFLSDIDIGGSYRDDLLSCTKSVKEDIRVLSNVTYKPMIKFVDAKKRINNELSLLEKIPDKQLLPEDFDTIECIKKINVEISSVRVQDLKSFDNIIRELYEEVDQVENSTKISSIRSNFLEVITHDSSLLTCITLVCI